VAKAFSARDGGERRRVLLVDDVVTSGATSSDCARALLEAGSESVDLLVAAHVSIP
jgi:predicted amidophosphoribosyltransferase